MQHAQRMGGDQHCNQLKMRKVLRLDFCSFFNHQKEGETIIAFNFEKVKVYQSCDVCSFPVQAFQLCRFKMLRKTAPNPTIDNHFADIQSLSYGS